MSNHNLAKFVKDNLVLIVCIPLIGFVHYGWIKLQNEPSLVDQSKKKEFPLIDATKAIYKKITGDPGVKD